MVEFSRGTRTVNTVTGAFRRSLKSMPKTEVLPVGQSASNRGSQSDNPTIQILKDLGIPLDALKRL